MANEFFFDTKFHIKMLFLQQILSFVYIHYLIIFNYYLKSMSNEIFTMNFIFWDG